MQIWLIPILLAVNYIPYKAMFWFFFPTMDEFKESIRYLLTPSILSLFRGEIGQDLAAKVRPVAYIIACAGMMVAEYFAVIKLLRVLGASV